MRREEGEARVGAARAVGIDRIAREEAEVSRVEAERIDMIGIARYARNDARIA